MNKQEQIKKIEGIALLAIDIAIGDNDLAGSEDKEEAAQYVAEDLHKAGYINGADFVRFVRDIFPQQDAWGNDYIYVDRFEEALQEYLKGE